MLRSVLLRALTVCALFVGLLPAQDEAKLLSAFQKVFTPPPKGKASLADKHAALATLTGLDSGKTAEALVESWLAIDAEMALLETQRDAEAKEIESLVKGQDPAHITLPSDQLDRLNQLRASGPKLRAQSQELQGMLAKLGERITTLHRRDSALWLLQRACGNKKYPAPLKVAAGKAVGAAAGEILEELAAALPKAKEPTDLIVLLDAFTLAGKAAAAHATPVLALLDHKEEAVAERAAQALAKLAVPAAIGPMVKLLERSGGQTKARVATALEILTGQQFGANVAAWQSWWNAEGAGFAAGGKELGAGTPSKRSAHDDRYYFGIPQDTSRAILYVIDCSGSMTAPVQLKTTGTSAGGNGGETTRLEACKTELIRGLSQLRPDQKFAILWYQDLPHFWEPKMQLASKETVARAQEFVKTLRANSSTNIHDSLEMGFRMVGRGSKDKYYGIDLDTIFLLTDGAPTTPDGKLDSTEKILVGARAWNPLKRVTIHCIAIGKDLNEQFLRQLASENGGEFKQF